jgi:hypothetical protein
MSNDKSQLSGPNGANRNPSIPQLKDTMILIGWIVALLIIAGTCWMLTEPLRDRFLIRAVNRVLEQSGDARRLGELSHSGASGTLGKTAAINEPVGRSFQSSFIIGSWYTMILARQPGGTLNGPSTTDIKDFSEGTKAFVFSFIGEGSFFPCAAVVLPDGKVKEFIPLSSHGERVLKKTSQGILNLYARRIEGAGS